MTQSEFDAKWCAAIRGRRDDRLRLDHEAVKAIDELRRSGYVDAACGSGRFRADIVDAARKYEQVRKWAIKTNRDFRRTQTRLDEIATELDTIARRYRALSPRAAESICASLETAADQITFATAGFELGLHQFWGKALAANAAEFDEAAESLSGSSKFGRIPYSAFSEEAIPGESGSLWYANTAEKRSGEEHVSRKRVEAVSTVRDLQRDLQSKIAVVLHHEFPKLRKATIARLVVLAIICCDLVEENEEGEMCMKGNKSRLTPSAVYQKLKGPQLQ
jgi:hypothetical protein